MAARGQLQFFFVSTKPLNLKVRNYSNFTITFPTLWRCAGDFFKVLLKFKMAATDQLQFFVGAKKLKKIVWSFFLNFNITWGCASDFLKMLPKFKIAARGQLNFFVGSKTLNISQKLFTFYNHIPTIWRCAGDFFKVLLKFKMAATNRLFLWAQKLNNFKSEIIQIFL